MGFFKKVLKIDNKRTEKGYTSFGTVMLYPNGTKREILKLTLKGWTHFNQVSTIKSDTDGETSFEYNHWNNI